MVDEWMVEIFNRFGAHLINYPTLKKRLCNKILTLKEEGDSSSINQAYKNQVVKSDKDVQCTNLGYLHQHWHHCSNIIDQWNLLICGLAAV